MERRACCMLGGPGMTRARVHLDTPTGKRPFPNGSYLIGRSEECDVVLASGRCSRKHARLLVSDEGATLEDLGSANGTFVNGQRITGPHSLADGDFVVVGGELGLDVSFEPDEPDSSAVRPSPSSPALEEGPYLPPTTKISADAVLESVADHLIAKGQPEQAERALSRWLETALAAAENGKWREDSLVDMSVRCAAKLAQSLPSRRWVDYVLELSSTLSLPLTADNANLLNDAITNAGVSSAPLSRYTSMLRALSATTDIARALDEAEAWQASASSK